MFYFFFNDTATTEIYTLSLHDALPISAVKARTLAPLSIAPIWNQRPGTAWAKAWTRVSGAGRYTAVVTKSWPDVPSDRKAAPSSMAPSPTAPAAASPAPPATTTDRESPQRRARSGRKEPAASDPSIRRGMWEVSSPVAARAARDQPRAASSSHQVPAASDISVTRSPVRHRRT